MLILTGAPSGRRVSTCRTTLVVYTDDAAQGNPDPTGARVTVTYPCWGSAASRHTEELSVCHVWGPPLTTTANFRQLVWS